ncbi:50S ribosomal protein P1 [[Eubacterium] cellulosolvens]
MKYIYAALLLHSSEKPIDEKSMKKVLTAAGIETDEARIKALVTSLAEVNIDDALKTAVTAAPAPTTPAAAAPEDAKKKEEKPKEEKKEEEALEGLGSLFG